MQVCNALFLVFDHVCIANNYHRKSSGISTRPKSGMFSNIGQDNCLIIQHVDNEAQLFYCRKAGDDLYFAIFPPDPQEITYIAGYLLTTDDEYSVQHDHI